MVNNILGHSYHADVCSSVGFSNLFRFKIVTWCLKQYEKSWLTADSAAHNWAERRIYRNVILWLHFLVTTAQTGSKSHQSTRWRGSYPRHHNIHTFLYSLWSKPRLKCQSNWCLPSLQWNRMPLCLWCSKDQKLWKSRQQCFYLERIIQLLKIIHRWCCEQFHVGTIFSLLHDIISLHKRKRALSCITLAGSVI